MYKEIYQLDSYFENIVSRPRQPSWAPPPIIISTCAPNVQLLLQSERTTCCGCFKAVPQ